jgi:chemotaxis protein MotB
VALKAAQGNLTITLGDKVLFRSGQWELQPRGQKVIEQVAQVLKKVDDKLFQVEGNTDNVPISGSLKQRFSSNWDLSSARASAVVRALEKDGVKADRLVLTAYGDKRPVGDNRTPEGRRLNRRVEISLLPLPPEKP